MNIHSIKDYLSFNPDALRALLRTAAAYDTPGIDLSTVKGSIAYGVSVGTVVTNGTLDCKWQESDDDSTYTDVSGGAQTQILAAGTVTYERNVRAFTKRYARLRATVAVANITFGVSSLAIAQKV